MEQNNKKSAILISVGDELLIGQTINSNAAWLGEKLLAFGIEVVEMITVGDNKSHMLRVLHESHQRAELVIVTGGLGPTRDDLTALVLGEYFQKNMVFNEEVFSWIKAFKMAQKKPVNELHRKQAYLPEDFIYFRNLAGTAPAMVYRDNGTIFVSLPGVPYEMKSLMNEYVFPWINKKISRKIFLTKTLHTAAVPESEIASILSDFEDNLADGLSLAYLPSLARVKIRINSRAVTEEEAKAALTKAESKIRELLGDMIYGENEDSLEGVVGRLLMEKKQFLGTAESCTGGYIAQMITSVPGASQYFNGSVVAYSNEVKMDLLGVKKTTLINHGAVSEETVVEMVKGICRRLKVENAIAVSGIAGPQGGSPEKPIGMVCLAVGNVENQVVDTVYLNHNRKLNIEKSAFLALNMLRLFLQRP
ncbi:MAG: competence/damage-inducible protein A [Saprospirales bacterium]|nr:MAG: competence/damage-inducible protein A [Saprospirales bacterium]